MQRQQQTQTPAPLSTLISQDLSSMGLPCLLYWSIMDDCDVCFAHTCILPPFSFSWKTTETHRKKGTQVERAGGVRKEKFWERDPRGSFSWEKKCHIQLMLFQKHTPMVVSVMLSSWYLAPCTLHLSTVRNSPLCEINTHTNIRSF